jgi:peptide/nickel transport system substrate-binding protein
VTFRWGRLRGPGCLRAHDAGATLRWSSQGDYLSADPHAQNEGLNNNINDHIFERLTAREKDLSLKPSLATSWETTSPRVWRFALRRGVTFHDGSPFTADDVVFSIQRAQLQSSNFKVFAAPLAWRARSTPTPSRSRRPGRLPQGVFLENVNAVRIMSKSWCEKHGALKPQDFKTGEETYPRATPTAPGPTRW